MIESVTDVISAFRHLLDCFPVLLAISPSFPFLSKVIRLAKKIHRETFRSITARPNESRSWSSGLSRFTQAAWTQLSRYIPDLTSIPLHQGRRLYPTWKATGLTVPRKLKERIGRVKSFFAVFPQEVAAAWSKDRFNMPSEPHDGMCFPLQWDGWRLWFPCTRFPFDDDNDDISQSGHPLRPKPYSGLSRFPHILRPSGTLSKMQRISALLFLPL